MSYRPWPGSDGKVHDLLVFAEHHQFCVSDAVPMRDRRRPGPEQRASGWTAQAVQSHRIVAEPYLIAVGTAWADWVEVTLREHEHAPAAGLENAVHVVEADLDVPAGVVSVFGLADAGEPSHRFTMASGSYRVRVSYVAADPPPTAFDEDEPGDHFRYVVDLWPWSGSFALAVG